MTLGRLASSGVMLVSVFAVSSGRPVWQAIQLNGAGFERGHPQAPVKVVEFGDFGCSACAQFAVEVWPVVEEEFVGTGRVHWTFVPFILGAFRNSKEATAAALCAAQQDAFWPMHDRLYQEQTRWSAARHAGPIVRQLAVDVGLDSLRFERCYQDKETSKQIGELTKLAKQLSVNATPTFFVGERRIRGTLPVALFRQVLQEAAVP